MTYRARKRLAILILVVGLPAYIVGAVTAMNALSSTSWPTFVEFAIYVILGVAWVFPLKWVFRGIGQADPDARD